MVTEISGILSFHFPSSFVAGIGIRYLSLCPRLLCIRRISFFLFPMPQIEKCIFCFTPEFY